jgi:hypothetical protein
VVDANRERLSTCNDVMSDQFYARGLAIWSVKFALVMNRVTEVYYRFLVALEVA